MNRREFLASSAGVALLTACSAGPQPPANTAAASATTTGTARIAPWGFDLAGMDRSARPGDDFAQYVGGNWMKTQSIPGDRTRWGAFDQLRDQADLDVRALVEETVKKGAAPGADERRIADFYATYIDVAAIEAKGLAPVKTLLDEIAACPDPARLAVLAARPSSAIPTPLSWGVGPDAKNPNIYTLSVGHGGLGLPNRTFYVGPTAKPALLSAYAGHIGRMLVLAGIPNASGKAAEVVTFETGIAEKHWLPEALRERDKTYNPRTRAELNAMAPAYPWDKAFEASLVGSADRLVVRQLDAIAPLADLWAKTSIDTLKAYAAYHVLREYAEVLPRAFGEEAFAFFGKTLNGQPQQRSREKRAIDALNGAMGEAVGRLYVARHFPPDSKAKMLVLVENMRVAYGLRIRALAWMSPDTKSKALEKLALFRPKIGYPDRWRDYSKLDIVKGDAFGNAQRVNEFERRRRLVRLGKKTGREEWNMTPQTVNASYNSVFNEITFPAAILQPPFFDPSADPAINYGGIGAVIGHEMGHGFDDQGAKSDGHGVLHDWWGPQDVASFKALVDRLAAQYSAFEPQPGVRVNGRLTLGENIGDNGGMQVALAAYHISLKAKQAPVLDGFTGDQRFFLGWGQVWRSLIRDEALRVQVATDPHSPGYYRTIGPVRNVDAWYAAFGVKPGDKNYLPPDQRVLIW